MRLHTQATLASGGDAVARAFDGRVVFIQGAAPDEVVEVEVIQSTKKYARAKVIEIIQASEARVDPQCDYFKVCGGCVTQHVHARAQTQSKHHSLVEALRRIGKVDLSKVQIDPAWSGDAYGYRNRARLALAPGNIVGFRARKSKRVVDVESCPILSASAQSALLDVRKLRLKPKRVEEFELIASSLRALVRLPRRYENSLSKYPASNATEFVFGDDNKSIEANDGREKLLLSPGVFAQSNPLGNLAMLDYITFLLGSVEHLIELYAGSGNFTRCLSSCAERIEIIEGEGVAIELAKQVLPDRIEVHTGSVEAVLAQRIEAGLQNVTILADPPRSGFSEELVELLLGLRANALVYVSCDPAIFARDVARLSSTYRLTQLQLFDLYPQTGHAEVVAKMNLL